MIKDECRVLIVRGIKITMLNFSCSISNSNGDTEMARRFLISRKGTISSWNQKHIFKFCI